jgi:hypothetical protein
MPRQSKPPSPHRTLHFLRNMPRDTRPSYADVVATSAPRSLPSYPNPDVSPSAFALSIERMEAIRSWLADVQKADRLPPTTSIVEGPHPPILTIVDGLLESLGKTKGPVYREHDYIPLTAHSPLHMGVGQGTPAWIVTHLGIIGEPVPSENTKLWPGSLIRLHDITLSQQNFSFEKPWLYGELGHSSRREPGYHIFPIDVDLFTITQVPYVVNCTIAYIAIPNHLIALQGRLASMHPPSLGQRVVEGIGEIQPPFRPWEADPDWRHPEYAKIKKWGMGLMPDLERRWAIFNARK